jgi:hypothetical protein
MGMADHIFMEYGMEFMPLDSVSKFPTIGKTNMMDAQISEVGR